MIKTMTARYRGRDADTGATINPGDDIRYCTATRRAWLHEPGDCQVDTGAGDAPATRTRSRYVSDVIGIGGREYYRNKAGRCIDAPCCGCCTI